jgi:hypothetical protein
MHLSVLLCPLPGSKNSKLGNERCKREDAASKQTPVISIMGAIERIESYFKKVGVKEPGRDVKEKR